MKIPRQTLLRLLGVLVILLSIPLLFVAYWTLFLPGADATTLEQTAKDLLNSLEITGPHQGQPILIVHGLHGGSGDGASVCEATEGPFAQDTLILSKRYIPLGQLGEALAADGYEPYYVILATSPEVTAPLQENGHCMEQQLRNFITRVNDQPGQKYTVIAHSMGGLVARACLAQSEFCRSTIDRLITLGSPHNGAPAFYSWKTGKQDCSADPGLCEMADDERIKHFNAQTPNQPGVHYVFIGGTWGLMNRRIHFLRENDGLVGAWSAIGMIVTSQDQPEFADWVSPNLPTVYFVANKHSISRRSGYAYYEAPAPGQTSDAYACIRYELGKLNELPTVCRPPAMPSTTSD